MKKMGTIPGPVYLLLTAVFWSFCGVFTKFIPWSGVTIASFRGIIAAVICMLALGYVRIKVTRAKLLMAFCYFGQSLLYICANKLTTAGSATVLQNTSPVFIILMTALFLKQKPLKKDVITCVVLLFGIVLSFAGSIGGGAVTGNILALCSALLYAGVFFTSKLPGANVAESVVLGNLMYLLCVPFWFFDREFMDFRASAFIAALAMGIFVGGVAWVLFSKGIKTTSPLAANFITMLEPVISPLWAFLFLREKLSPLSLRGGAVVIVTLVVYNTTSIRGQKEHAAAAIKDDSGEDGQDEGVG